MARLKEIYSSELVAKLKEELKLDNVMEVPRITKITINMGVGEALTDKKVLENAQSDFWKKLPVKNLSLLRQENLLRALRFVKHGQSAVK